MHVISRIGMALAALFSFAAIPAACAGDAPQPVAVEETITTIHTPIVIVVTATPTPPTPGYTPQPPTQPPPTMLVPENTLPPTSRPIPSPAFTPQPTLTPMAQPTPTPAPTQTRKFQRFDAVTWDFLPTIDGDYLHFAGTTSQPGLLQEFILGDNPYCSQFHLYRGSDRRDWVASIKEPLPAGRYYGDVPEVITINGWINSETGRFSVTARINGEALDNAEDLHLSVVSRAVLGADGFCLPSDTYSHTLVASGKIPADLKSEVYYHSDVIRWIDPPTITGDTLKFAGRTLPGSVRLTWQEGYCSQFHLYELDEAGYHYIDSINPLLPSGRFWNGPVMAEITNEHTAPDGTFQATVKLTGNALAEYRNPVLLVGAQSVLNINTNKCVDSEVLSAIDIRSSSALLSPTPTPAPKLPPTLSPTPTAAPITPTPTPVLQTPHNTRNMRWLQSVHPALHRQIQQLLWVQDGLTETERDALDQLLYLGVQDIANLEDILKLGWVQSEISETEYNALYWLRALNYEDPLSAAAIIAAPFLESLAPADVLAIRGMHSLAIDGWLSILVGHPALQNGITDAHAILIAAAGTLNHPQEISRMMTPGYAAIETFSNATELSPRLKISVVRTGTQSSPSTADYVREAVQFVERTMQRRLPVSHVILVLNDQAVTGGFAGTNHGFAFGYRPKHEEGQASFDKYSFQAGIVHEVAHYFWSGNEDWIDEGLANTFEYVYGLENGISPGILKSPRKDCEAHDLEMLMAWNPGKDEVHFYCNYHLGQLLFQELLESLGGAAFNERLQELYRLSQVEQEADYDPGIIEVRKVFQGEGDIVEKHWSGKLNAPENRPYDEMAGIVSHGLVEWEQYPAYDRGTVELKGKLLGGAVFQDEDLKNPSAGKTYTPTFIISVAGNYDYRGSIMPGDEWHLDPEDAAASKHHYYPATNTFVLRFPFPKVLGNPSDYAIVVRGFSDKNRTNFLRDEGPETLGYARIRSE